MLLAIFLQSIKDILKKVLKFLKGQFPQPNHKAHLKASKFSFLEVGGLKKLCYARWIFWNPQAPFAGIVSVITM